jgi:transposase
MHARSSLSEDQREAAVAWFEKGIADSAAARLLGVSRGPVKLLYRRWKIHGRGALMAKPTKEVYSFEFKLALVERFIAGETAPDLAAEVGLSSSGLLKRWAREYRREARMRCVPSLKADPRHPMPRRRWRYPSWSGCGGRTNGCGRKWLTWENCGP